MNFAALVREHWMQSLVPIGIVLGIYLDRWNDSRLTQFRNKSALYKRFAYAYAIIFSLPT